MILTVSLFLAFLSQLLHGNSNPRKWLGVVFVVVIFKYVLWDGNTFPVCNFKQWSLTHLDQFLATSSQELNSCLLLPTLGHGALMTNGLGPTQCLEFFVYLFIFKQIMINKTFVLFICFWFKRNFILLLILLSHFGFSFLYFISMCSDQWEFTKTFLGVFFFFFKLLELKSLWKGHSLYS